MGNLRVEWYFEDNENSGIRYSEINLSFLLLWNKYVNNSEFLKKQKEKNINIYLQRKHGTYILLSAIFVILQLSRVKFFGMAH